MRLRRSAHLLGISILTVTVATQPVFLLAAGAPQAGPELGFGSVGLGLLSTAFFLAAALASAPAGRIVERIGWPAGMRLSTAGAIVSLLAIGLLGRSTGVVAVLLVVAAVSYGFANPSANLALAQAAAPGRQGTFFGIKHAGIPGSTLLAGLAVPLVNLQWGWRWSYAVAAVVAMVLLLLIPRRATEAHRSPAPIRPIERPMTAGELRRLAVVAGTITIAPGALGTFTVIGAVEAGLSEAAAGWTLSVAGLATILARAGYGMVADRWGRGGITPLFLVIAGGSVTLAALAFASGGWFVPAAVAAFAVAWGWPGLMTFSVVEGNVDRPAAATAITQAGVFFGAGIGPPLFGWIEQQGGFRTAWLVTAGALLVGAVVAFPLARDAVARHAAVDRRDSS